MAWSVKYKPGIVAGGNVSVAPPTGALSVSGAVAKAIRGTKILPATAALLLAGNIPVAHNPIRITPLTGSITLAGLAPVVTNASTATFDFYISPTGNDVTGNGSLSSPWAITSLTRVSVNSKNTINRAAMAGKRIGLLPGTYGIYSLWITGVTNLSGGLATASSSSTGTYGWNTPVLTLPGGVSSSQRTFLGASDSSGHQTLGSHPLSITHAITASPSGTPGGGLPGFYSGGTSTQSIAIIGADVRDVASHIQIDGIAISDSTNLITSIYGGSTAGGTTGRTSDNGVTNCLVYNCGGNEGNNTGAVWFGGGADGSFVQNCIIHNVQIPGGSGQHNCAGIFTEACIGNLYEYNTIYDCNSGIYDKNFQDGGHTYRYNYVEVNGTNPQDCLMDCAGGPTGTTSKVYNNILVIAPLTSNERMCWQGICTNGPTSQPDQFMQFYNNTCYVLSGGGFQGGMVYQSPGVGSVTHYNNIYVSAAPGFYSTISFNTSLTAVAISDYNAYIGGCGAGSNFGRGTNGAPSTNYTLASWRSTFSLDVNSINPSSASGVFSNPGQPQLPTGYQLTSGSPCIGKGKVGGVSSGATIDQGAWGGTDVNTSGPITQIGSSL